MSYVSWSVASQSPAGDAVGSGGLAVLPTRGAEAAGFFLPRTVPADKIARGCAEEGKKVTGTICAKHPPGRSGKWCLSPFPGWPFVLPRNHGL